MYRAHLETTKPVTTTLGEDLGESILPTASGSIEAALDFYSDKLQELRELMGAS